MLKAGYRIELDFFSGLQNPSFEIKKEDFISIYNEVVKLEKAGSIQFFDGLGFRGVVLAGMNSPSVHIQNKIIKVETVSEVNCFKSKQDIILKAINLFKKYDRENNYKMLIEKATHEYL